MPTILAARKVFFFSHRNIVEKERNNETYYGLDRCLLAASLRGSLRRD
jgi:hypothetical protein